MPMVARGKQFTGESGGSRFFWHALTYGVAPTVLHARDWSNLCPEARSSGSEPLFPADILMRGVVHDNRLPTNSDFRAGRSARASAFELLEHKLAPNIATWVSRFFSTRSSTGSSEERSGASVGRCPPRPPGFLWPGRRLASH